MISEAELRRHAVAAGVDTMVQDLDYGLGWFLAGLFVQTPAAQHLVFKGGTCLRKCYFANYRFSDAECMPRLDQHNCARYACERESGTHMLQ